VTDDESFREDGTCHGRFHRLPIEDGSGDFRVNRFRIAFQPPNRTSAATLAGDLINNFPTYFNSEFAKVEWGSRKHEGKLTLHFHGYAKVLGLDLAKPHDDWVVRHWVDPNIGFTAQTLKREFFVAGDDIAAGVGAGLGSLALNMIPVVGLVGQVLGPVGSVIAGGGATIHYNRMHFLAGRRSWRISDGAAFGLSSNVIVLETVALERFSAAVYRTADAVIGLESRVPNVWIALLNNFVNKKGLTVAPQTLKPRWKNKNRVDYLQLSFREDDGPMLADPEFRDVLRLYRTVWPI
jgi:hypothetical protein